MTNMNSAVQEGAGGQDNRGGGQISAGAQSDPARNVGCNQQIDNLILDDRQGGTGVKGLLHGAAIERAVCLRPRPLRGRPLAAVEEAELDAGGVGGDAHQPVEGVDFADDVAFAQSADRRVAGHFAEAVKAVRDQCGARAHAVRRQRGLGPRMTAANDDHVVVVMFHVKQSYLPRQNCSNTTSRIASTSTRPTRKSSARSAPRRCSAARSTPASPSASVSPAATTIAAASRTAAR